MDVGDGFGGDRSVSFGLGHWHIMVGFDLEDAGVDGVGGAALQAGPTDPVAVRYNEAGGYVDRGGRQVGFEVLPEDVGEGIGHVVRFHQGEFFAEPEPVCGDMGLRFAVSIHSRADMLAPTPSRASGLRIRSMWKTITELATQAPIHAVVST
jgi:hypothetical protein